MRFENVAAFSTGIQKLFVADRAVVLLNFVVDGVLVVPHFGLGRQSLPANGAVSAIADRRPNGRGNRYYWRAAGNSK